MIPDYILDVDIPDYQMQVDDGLDIDFDVGMTSGGGTRDHNVLIHRDMENQHPISAINQLTQELSARPTEIMTNMDIQVILNS